MCHQYTMNVQTLLLFIMKGTFQVPHESQHNISDVSYQVCQVSQQHL